MRFPAGELKETSYRKQDGRGPENVRELSTCGDSLQVRRDSNVYQREIIFIEWDWWNVPGDVFSLSEVFGADS